MMKVSKAQSKQRADWATLGWDIASYAVLVIVTVGVMALSWEGLSGFGTEQLNLGNTGYLLPLALDGMTIMFLVMSVASTVSGDSATGAKVLVYLYAVVSAVFNGYHAYEKYDRSWWAVCFYVGTSFSVALALHWLLKHAKRKHLRQIGVLERPIAQFRILRWIRFPIRTFRAWSLALEFGLSSPDEAWTLMLDRKSGQSSPVRTVQLDRPDRTPSGGSPVGLSGRSDSVQSGSDRPALPGPRPDVQPDPVVQSGPDRPERTESGYGTGLDTVQPEPSSARQTAGELTRAVQSSRIPDGAQSGAQSPSSALDGVDDGPDLTELSEAERTALDGMTKAGRVQWAVQRGVRPDAATIRQKLMQIGYPVGRSTIFDTLKRINSDESGSDSTAGLRAVR